MTTTKIESSFKYHERKPQSITMRLDRSGFSQVYRAIDNLARKEVLADEEIGKLRQGYMLDILIVLACSTNSGVVNLDQLKKTYFEREDFDAITFKEAVENVLKTLGINI